MIFEPIVCSVQTVHLCCVKYYHYLQTDWTELPLQPRHLGVPSGASKTISEPMVHSAQIVHLSCTDTYTTSRRTETRFHMTHVTSEFHRVRQKWFLILWYVRCKPCTYLVSRLGQSLNELSQASTWASSLRNTTRCVQNDLWANGMFGANRAPILRQDYHYLETDWTKLALEPRHLGVPPGAFKMIYEPIVCLAQTAHLSCVKITIIPKWTESSFHMSLVT
jgi:hypothetical protein